MCPFCREGDKDRDAVVTRRNPLDPASGLGHHLRQGRCVHAGEQTQGLADLVEVRAPGDDGGGPVDLDAPLQQAALGQREVAPASPDPPAGAEVDPLRVVAVEVAVELQGALAADEQPVAALGAGRVSRNATGAPSVDARAPAGQQVALGRVGRGQVRMSTASSTRSMGGRSSS